MASSPPDPASISNKTYRSLLSSTPQWQALDRLTGGGLDINGILALSKLGAAGVGKLYDLFEKEKREGMETLVAALNGLSEDDLKNWISTIASEKNERGTSRSCDPHSRPSCPLIDNLPAPTISTPYVHLRPPHSPLPSVSTVSSPYSVSSSSSTKGTYSSSSKRQRITPKSAVKTTRKQLYCPQCTKPIKNGFDNHFVGHILGIFGAEVGDDDAVGCGYCDRHDLLVDQGKVFHGASEFIRHVKEAHASSPQQLRWDFNASFTHVISAQPLFRRKITWLIDQEIKKNEPNNTFLTLSWTYSKSTQQLLSLLQTVSGSIDNNTYDWDANATDDLVTRVYSAASTRWQPLSVLTAVPQLQVPQSLPARPRSVSQPHRPSPDLIGIGHHLAHTPKYPASAIDARSLSSFASSPQASQPAPPPAAQHVDRSIYEWGTSSQQSSSTEFGSLPQPPSWSFDGMTPYPTQSTSQKRPLTPVTDICNDMGVNVDDLYQDLA